MRLTEEQIKQAAEEFAAGISTSTRVHADIYIGGAEYNSVTAVVKAAFIAGAQMAKAQVEK